MVQRFTPNATGSICAQKALLVLSYSFSFSFFFFSSAFVSTTLGDRFFLFSFFCRKKRNISISYSNARFIFGVERETGCTTTTTSWQCSSFHPGTPQCDISVGKQQLTKCTPIHLSIRPLRPGEREPYPNRRAHTQKKKETEVQKEIRTEHKRKNIQ